jgi:hypothetical protein
MWMCRIQYTMTSELQSRIDMFVLSNRAIIIPYDVQCSGGCGGGGGGRVHHHRIRRIGSITITIMIIIMDDIHPITIRNHIVVRLIRITIVMITIHMLLIVIIIIIIIMRIRMRMRKKRIRWVHRVHNCFINDYPCYCYVGRRCGMLGDKDCIDGWSTAITLRRA